MPLSHDEVVHGKRSLLEKMPGDAWQKLANLRAAASPTSTRGPARSCSSWARELAPWREWNHDASLDWHLADDPQRARPRRASWPTSAGSTRRRRASGAATPIPASFAWIDCDDRAELGLRLRAARRRRALGGRAQLHAGAARRLPHRRAARGRVRRSGCSTDDRRYGGSGYPVAPRLETEPVPSHGQPQSLRVALPPLAALVLVPGLRALRVADRPKLGALADAIGILPSYRDLTGKERHTSDAARVALLAAMRIDASTEARAAAALADLAAAGADRVLEPVVVTPQSRAILVANAGAGRRRGGDARRHGTRLAWEATVTTEAGKRHDLGGRSTMGIDGALRLRLPVALPLGYHHVRLAVGDGARRREGEQTLIVTPPRCPTASAVLRGRKVCGLLANLYTARSGRNWGAGDFGDLGDLVAVVRRDRRRLRRGESAARARQSRRRDQPLSADQPALSEPALPGDRRRPGAPRRRRGAGAGRRARNAARARGAARRAPRRLRARDGAEAAGARAAAPDVPRAPPRARHGARPRVPRLPRARGRDPRRFRDLHGDRVAPRRRRSAGPRLARVARGAARPARPGGRSGSAPRIAIVVDFHRWMQFELDRQLAAIAERCTTPAACRSASTRISRSAPRPPAATPGPFATSSSPAPASARRPTTTPRPARTGDCRRSIRARSRPTATATGRAWCGTRCNTPARSASIT